MKLIICHVLKLFAYDSGVFFMRLEDYAVHLNTDQALDAHVLEAYHDSSGNVQPLHAPCYERERQIRSITPDRLSVSDVVNNVTTRSSTYTYFAKTRAIIWMFTG